jgi:hypothetical protein
MTGADFNGLPRTMAPLRRPSHAFRPRSGVELPFYLYPSGSFMHFFHSPLFVAPVKFFGMILL